MERPYPTDITPKRIKGIRFNFLVSLIETRTLLFFCLWVSSACVKLSYKVLFMGMIALTQGISIAIESACNDALNSGTIDGVKPMSAVNTTLYM